MILKTLNVCIAQQNLTLLQYRDISIVFLKDDIIEKICMKG